MSWVHGHGWNPDDNFSVTRETGADGTLTLTAKADGFAAGQHIITEILASASYTTQAKSQVVTVMPNDFLGNTFTFYNEPDKPGDFHIPTPS